MNTTKPKVLFFDINETLLDIQEVKDSVASALGSGPEVVSLWFTMMLQYSLVATVGSQYEDFDKIAVAALMMVAKSRGLELTEKQAREAIMPILRAKAYPEVRPALTQLKNTGFTIVALANSTSKALATQLSNTGLTNLFDKQLSVQKIGLYKPHLDVYHSAAKEMNVSESECMLIAAHGWDIAGAAWAGMQTAFIARPGQALYPLAPEPDIIADDIALLAKQLLQENTFA